MTYEAEYTPLFDRNARRYRSLRKQIRQKTARTLQDPYQGTERLGKTPGGMDLSGCRSVRVTRNFRIIFVICEECRRVPECEFCFCEGLPGETVIFITVGPHERAYAVREALAEYGVEEGISA